ncbi:MAG: ABC transporter permease [Cyclobacteriaceae bacterium]|nr:ABC transporter permease [Cyclobacteriaceae bacterium]
MLFSISWRNVWRNKLRSAVIIIAIALGICAGVFSSAFYKGMADQRIDKAIKTEISHIQVHRPKFRQANDISQFIPEADELAARIGEIPEVSGVSSRIIIFSMASSAETASGVKISGVMPGEESKVTNLHTKLIEGNYFEEERRNPIIVGWKLAEKLNVKMGSKIVLTLQDIDNNIVAGAFRIIGIFNTANGIYDESNVFVKHEDLRRLMELPDHSAHELAILVEDNELIRETQEKIQTLTGNLEVLSWTELSPEMNYLNEAMDLFMYIFIIIILFALLFGIINTMLMVVLERIKEIGMLMAIGMNRLRVFMMIVLESIFLSLTGGVIGVLMGGGISIYFETNRIDLSMWGEVYQDLGYDPYVYTSLEFSLLVNVTILVIITGIIASLYPAYKALKNDPADALRIE